MTASKATAASSKKQHTFSLLLFFFFFFFFLFFLANTTTTTTTTVSATGLDFNLPADDDDQKPNTNKQKSIGTQSVRRRRCFACALCVYAVRTAVQVQQLADDEAIFSLRRTFLYLLSCFCFCCIQQNSNDDDNNENSQPYCWLHLRRRRRNNNNNNRISARSYNA